MIHACLQFIRSQLNAYLATKADREFLCLPPHTGDGKWCDAPTLSVINVEEERFTREQELERTQVDLNKARFRQPPIKLNLQLLFAVPCRTTDVQCSEKNYLQSLQSLSNVIAYFQSVPRFTADEYPELAAAGIHRLALDLLTLTPEQMNQIWSCIGTRYIPSVIYRLRLLRLSSDIPSVEQPLVQSVSSFAGVQQ